MSDERTGQLTDNLRPEPGAPSSAGSAVTTELGQLEDRLGRWQAAARPEAAEVAVAAGWTDESGQTVAGLDAFDAQFAAVLAPKTLSVLRREHEREVRTAYDARLAAEGNAITRMHTELVRRLREVAATFEAPPTEPDPGVDATRQLAGLQMLQGRHIEDVATLYARTSDDANPTLVALIEGDLGAFRLVPDRETDLPARAKLTQAIAARRSARVPEELREVLERAQGLLKPLNVGELLRHFQGGRGVANVSAPPAPNLRAV